MLEALDRGNLFLVPLDDRRRWYRYHHLFADVLQARLLDERPGQVPDLHRRASAWYQRNGQPPMAIGHALAARDFGQAADLIERAIPAMRITRQEAMVHGWLKALPDEVVRVRPMLSFAVAGALLALQRAAEQDGPVLRGTADMYVGMSEVHRERGDLQAATQQLLRSQELGEYNGLPQNPYRWRVAMARIRQAEGDLDGALDLLNEAERLYVGDFFPNVRPVPALKARVWIAQGRLGEARGWAREQGLSADDDLSYLREFEHITLARALLARSPVREAIRLLERLLPAAEQGERTRHVIEITVLRALAHQTLRDIPAALAGLERALTLAEPEGYVRVFADEGPPMASLLRVAEKQRIGGNYAGRLLAAMDERHDPVKQVLIEPLSERELDVLRLLGTELGGPAIARELMVSLNTVRTHTKHIYAKLAVTNRRAAVRRARELDLLSRS